MKTPADLDRPSRRAARGRRTGADCGGGRVGVRSSRAARRTAQHGEPGELPDAAARDATPALRPEKPSRWSDRVVSHGEPKPLEKPQARQGNADRLGLSAPPRSYHARR
jgi:hypothetical protein